MDRYAAATGRVVHPDEVTLYRQRWDLTDIALFVRQLHGPHVPDDDTAIAWQAMQQLLTPKREY